MTAYSFTLAAHSGLRWLVLFLAVAAITKSIIGWYADSGYGKPDKILASSYVGLMDLTFLLGLVLYLFLSPLTDQALDDFGRAMKDPTLRFWAVEHLTLMFLAVGTAHMGKVFAKKKAEATSKFKMQSIFFLISLVLMVAGIPWDRV